MAGYRVEIFKDGKKISSITDFSPKTVGEVAATLIRGIISTNRDVALELTVKYYKVENWGD